MPLLVKVYGQPGPGGAYPLGLVLSRQGTPPSPPPGVGQALEWLLHSRRDFVGLAPVEIWTAQHQQPPDILLGPGITQPEASLALRGKHVQGIMTTTANLDFQEHAWSGLQVNIPSDQGTQIWFLWQRPSSRLETSLSDVERQIWGGMGQRDPVADVPFPLEAVPTTPAGAVAALIWELACFAWFGLRGIRQQAELARYRQLREEFRSLSQLLADDATAGRAVPLLQRWLVSQEDRVLLVAAKATGDQRWGHVHTHMVGNLQQPYTGRAETLVTFYPPRLARALLQLAISFPGLTEMYRGHFVSGSWLSWAARVHQPSGSMQWPPEAIAALAAQALPVHAQAKADILIPGLVASGKERIQRSLQLASSDQTPGELGLFARLPLVPGQVLSQCTAGQSINGDTDGIYLYFTLPFDRRPFLGNVAVVQASPAAGSQDDTNARVLAVAADQKGGAPIIWLQATKHIAHGEEILVKGQAKYRAHKSRKVTTGVPKVWYYHPIGTHQQDKKIIVGAPLSSMPAEYIYQYPPGPKYPEDNPEYPRGRVQRAQVIAKYSQPTHLWDVPSNMTTVQMQDRLALMAQLSEQWLRVQTASTSVVSLQTGLVSDLPGASLVAHQRLPAHEMVAIYHLVHRSSKIPAHGFLADGGAPPGDHSLRVFTAYPLHDDIKLRAVVTDEKDGTEHQGDWLMNGVSHKDWQSDIVYHKLVANHSYSKQASVGKGTWLAGSLANTSLQLQTTLPSAINATLIDFLAYDTEAKKKGTATNAEKMPFDNIVLAISTTRVVEAGEPILVDYGSAYWKPHERPGLIIAKKKP